MKVPVELNANETIKALGLAWNTASDSFGFKATLDQDIANQIHTKRSAISTLGKLFDPIGLTTTIIVVGKIVMKKVWAAALDWDDSLPSDLRDKWIKYINGLQNISEIKVPRWINTSRSNTSFQMHGFCDASSMAYGAAIYLRTIDRNNKVHVHLLSSKSKIAPKKALTIPRLELCGAHLLSKLLTTVRNGLRHESIAVEDTTLWCDSEIVLYWLRSGKQLKVFVENRVSKINEATIGMQWRHVRTHDNPADLVSRGVLPSELANSALWWNGPSWLRYAKTDWPTSRINISPPVNTDLEVRRIVQTNVCAKSTSTDLMNDFSTYNRLIRITALCKRFIHNFRSSSNRRSGKITIEELKFIQRHWILEAQKNHYSDEWQCLNKEVPDALDSRSKLFSLVPFADGNGILRIRGRLENSTLSYDEMHPIILPPKHHFASLLIDRFHLRSMHAHKQKSV